MYSATVIGPDCRMRSTISARQSTACVGYSFVIATNVSWPCLQTSRNALPPERIACSARLASATDSTGRRFTWRMTSPGRTPARAAGPDGVHVRHEHARRARAAPAGGAPTSAPSGPSVRPNPPPASSASPCFSPPVSASRSSSSTVTDRFFSCLSCTTLIGHGRPGLGGHDELDERVAVGHRLAVELDDDVTGLDAGLGGRTVRRDRAGPGPRVWCRRPVLQRRPSGRSARSRRSGRAPPCRFRAAAESRGRR